MAASSGRREGNIDPRRAVSRARANRISKNYDRHRARTDPNAFVQDGRYRNNADARLIVVNCPNEGRSVITGRVNTAGGVSAKALRDFHFAPCARCPRRDRSSRDITTSCRHRAAVSEHFPCFENVAVVRVSDGIGERIKRRTLETPPVTLARATTFSKQSTIAKRPNPWPGTFR